MNTKEAIDILEGLFGEEFLSQSENEALTHAIEHMKRGQWQTMENAPKHENILMLMKHGAIEGTWDGETGYGYYWTDIQWYATHWMPLPKPPQESTTKLPFQAEPRKD